MRILTVLLSFFLFPSGSHCASFRDAYPGARANSMGTAFTGVADDPYAIFYNPAGLSDLSRVEIAGGLGKRFSPLGSGGEASFVYARPVPDRKSGVAGLGYYTLRQHGVGSKDALVAGWGDKYLLKSLQKPLSWGVNFRMVNLSLPGQDRFGVGADAGVLLESVKGLKTGVSVTDMDMGLGTSLISLNLGASYRWKNTLFSADVRSRSGLSELFPGIEHYLLNGLLRLRAGKGLSLDGVSQLAMGFGVTLYPLLLDTAMSIPWEGFHTQAGYYQLSVGYRFDAPHFSETFVGQAAGRAEVLKREIGVLESRKMQLDASVATAEVNKGVLEADLRTLQMRLEDMKARLKNLELDVLESQRYRESPQPAKAPVIPAPEKWPKKHTVEAGDTLRSMASRYYGDPSLWEIIFEANPGKISRGLPEIGSVLEIPSPPSKKK